MCALALFLPASRSQTFITSHDLWFWGGLFFTGLYLLFTGIHEIGKKVAIPLQQRCKEKRMKFVLVNLPDDEFQVVLQYVKGNKTSVDFVSGRADGTLLDLVTKGVLTRGIGYESGYAIVTSYEITSEANKCVRESDIRQAFLNRGMLK
ncbi:super-infection exclusion protein B [Edaphobacter paludis]|uniref:super-infection exclusion protein B n=1 Tax=Edaphobacter paludis TaxID=3035702 RepID=UPI0035A115B4